MNSEELTEIRKEHSTQIVIRWDELDPNDHVNNKNFQGYLDEARMRAMRGLGFFYGKTKNSKFWASNSFDPVRF